MSMSCSGSYGLQVPPGLLQVLEDFKKRVREFGSSSSSTVAMEVHPQRQIFDIPVVEAEFFM